MLFEALFCRSSKSLDVSKKSFGVSVLWTKFFLFSIQADGYNFLFSARGSVKQDRNLVIKYCWHFEETSDYYVIEFSFQQKKKTKKKKWLPFSFFNLFHISGVADSKAKNVDPKRNKRFWAINANSCFFFSFTFNFSIFCFLSLSSHALCFTLIHYF